MFDAQLLDSRQYAAEQISDGQPEIHLYVSAHPPRERTLESVVHRYAECQRPEYRQHDEEERPEHVYHQRHRLEHQFQDIAEAVAYHLLQLVQSALRIHPRHRRQVRRRYAEVVQFLVKLRIVHQVGRLRVALHHLSLQLVLLLPQLVEVELLPFEHRAHALHYRTHHAVHRAEHQRREEQDADADGERTQHREHIYRLSPRQRLPYPVGDVEERTEPGHRPCHARHL